MGRVIVAWLSALAWLYALTPRSLRWVAWGPLALFLRSIGFRREIIQQNLSIAYPGESLQAQVQRADLVREAYRHLGQLAWEVLLLMGPMPRVAHREVDFFGYEHIQAARKLGKGVLILSSHVGNWEVLAAGAGMLHRLDPLLITKRLKPAWFHDAIERGRKAAHVTGTYEPRTFRDVLAKLKSNGLVGVVLDQYAGPPVGVRVPVFGVPVGTHSVVAMVARRTGAAVLPAHCIRQTDGRFRIEVGPAIPWKSEPDSQREIAVNTARYAAHLEGVIRAHPGQWLWTHRRFKGELGPLRPGEWEEGRSRS